MLFSDCSKFGAASVELLGAFVSEVSHGVCRSKAGDCSVCVCVSACVSTADARGCTLFPVVSLEFEFTVVGTE